MMADEAASAASRPLNLHEYEEAARAILPPMAFHYAAGGADDEVTLRANRVAFDHWRLLPRVMQGIDRPSLATTVLGQQISLPVLLAPAGFHRLFHEDGELATARAAARAGTVLISSTAATCAMEEVAPLAGPWWFQLYVYQDRAITRELVQRAAACGAAALVVTVDTPLLGRREADERHRFVLPEGLAAANLAQSRHRLMAPAAAGSGLTSWVTAFEPALRWADLEWLAGLSALPIVAKGILDPADAARAVEHGVRAIVVSNHGGRQLDGAVATLDALPAVADRVAGRVEVLLDGGVRRGTDVLKALALGARAVCIGRPYLWGLAVGGEEGVLRVIELLRAEIALALVLSGRPDVARLDRALVVPPGPLAGGAAEGRSS